MNFSLTQEEPTNELIFTLTLKYVNETTFLRLCTQYNLKLDVHIKHHRNNFLSARYLSRNLTFKMSENITLQSYHGPFHFFLKYGVNFWGKFVAWKYLRYKKEQLITLNPLNYVNHSFKWWKYCLYILQIISAVEYF